MRAGMDEAWVTCADVGARALREPVTFIVGRGRGRL